MFAKFLHCLNLLAFLTAFVLLNNPGIIAGEGRAAGLQNSKISTTTGGREVRFWSPNRVGVYITNFGHLASHLNPRGFGMFWPGDSENNVNFAAGIYLSGIKEKEAVASISEFTTDYQPGTVNGWALGTPGTPAEPDSGRYRLYIIDENDLEQPVEGGDFLNWPVADGAPTDKNGKPLLTGASTAWTVFNDLNDSLHSAHFSNVTTVPIGVEVQMTAWGFDRLDALGDMLFFRYKIINKSGKDIKDTYVGFWVALDLNGLPFGLVGSAPSLSLAYTYDNQLNRVYGINTPAIGYKFVQGPVIPSAGDTAFVSGRILLDFKNLPMAAFQRIDGSPQFYPQTSQELHNVMRGLDRDGKPIIDPTTNNATPYWYPGDPLAGEGWLDDTYRVKEFVMSSGPFHFADGDSQEVAFAAIIAQGATALESVSILKQNASLAKTVYENPAIVTALHDGRSNNVPAQFELFQNYPNPFNPATTIRYSVDSDQFVSLKIYDIFGREVATLENGKRSAGEHAVEWNATGVASGVYFYRLQAGSFAETRKLLLIR